LGEVGVILPLNKKPRLFLRSKKPGLIFKKIGAGFSANS
jgi:hypothetical protein